MAWTDDRVETLKKLWADGLSASQIAKQLGGVTRNAVIGKVHRLGLSGRATPSRPPQRRVASKPATPRAKPSTPAQVKAKAPAAPSTQSKPTTAPVPVQSAPKPAPVEAEPLPNGEYATVLTLKDSMCKWPIGDPADPKFAFCGRKSTSGPYCSEHAKVAFQPAKKREKKKAEYDYVRKIAG